uniref:Tpd52 like 2b n=1 Tax=Hucho hucho TaxID=62062 RepID=A0A4W5JLS0_9TELE
MTLTLQFKTFYSLSLNSACPPAPTLSLDPDINLNSPNKGLGPAGGAGPLTDVPVEDGAMGVSSINTLPPGLTEEEAEEIRSELVKVEEEINTLRQVLLAKEKHSADLKRKLGLSPLNELKQNLTKGWQDVQTSNAEHQGGCDPIPVAFVMTGAVTL